MRDKVVDKLIIKINNKNNLDKIKLAEIRYGLQGLYTLITKSFGILLISFFIGFLQEFLIFNLFYIPLRSVGYGAHANSNFQCWFFSIFLILGFPLLFTYLKITTNIKVILWGVCLLIYIIFSPADTKKRPIRSKKLRLKFKIYIILINILYLFLLITFNKISDLIISAILLQALLVSPLGYILMGQEIRFSLNDIYLFKLK